MSLHSLSHKPIWHFPLPTTGRSRPVCQRRRRGVCGGRLVLLLGPDGPEGLTLHYPLLQTFSAPLSLLFSSQQMGGIWFIEDHLNLEVPLKTHGYFCLAGLWDELGEPRCVAYRGVSWVCASSCSPRLRPRGVWHRQQASQCPLKNSRSLSQFACLYYLCFTEQRLPQECIGAQVMRILPFTQKRHHCVKPTHFYRQSKALNHQAAS